MSDQRRGRETEIAALSTEIAACRICVTEPTGAPLPHEPRPVVRPSATARICICGQAPGTRVHASGVPFTDPSGDRLRAWMGVDDTQFYDTGTISIIPMGFCFPGLDAKGGDKPPRRECSRVWHDRVFASMPQVELVLAIGLYAQKWHLGAERKENLTATVAAWKDYADRSPRVIPLPHPSWRNNAWIKRNPWFETELLPEVKAVVGRLTGAAAA